MPLASAFIGDLGDLITGIATAVIAGGAVYAALKALRDYGEQTRERRGRWLMELRLTFADRPAYQTVREQLYDERKRPGRSQLSVALDRKQPDVAGDLDAAHMKMLVALDDYLDFFELIKHLVDNDQLGLTEADQISTGTWRSLSRPR